MKEMILLLIFENENLYRWYKKDLLLYEAPQTAKALILKAQKMMNKYTKMAIGTTGIMAAAIIASIVGIIYLSATLWEANPAYPGMAAFIFGGCVGSYIFFLKMHKIVISKLAEMDLRDENN